MTVLYPFLPPEDISDDVVQRVATAVGSIPAFDCTFAGTAWFGDEVLWLRPEPDGPLRALTQAVWTAFPTHPPYGGVHSEVVPHLTVGETLRDSVARLREAEGELLRALPLTTRLTHAWLIQGAEVVDSWRLIAEFPLGRHRAP